MRLIGTTASGLNALQDGWVKVKNRNYPAMDRVLDFLSDADLAGGWFLRRTCGDRAESQPPLSARKMSANS
jgi:hypothetical protein